MVAAAMRQARDPWWIIAGAAAALHGVEGPVADVDVLASERDAGRMAQGLDLPIAPGGTSDRFRSAVFLRWTAPPIAVEIMAGFEVRAGGRWTAVAPATRVAVPVGKDRVFVPERAELRDMLLLFGREKDHKRAERLAV